MGKQKYKLRGFEASITLMKKYKDNAEKYMHEAMEDIIRRIGARSQKYCPESTQEEFEKRIERPGENPVHMRDTMQITSERLGHWQITYDAYYAVFVHEVPPSKVHHEPPTRWKFLEQAVNDFYPIITKEVGAQFDYRMSAFGKGGPNDWVKSNQVLAAEQGVIY